jgi:hypothetical protein
MPELTPEEKQRIYLEEKARLEAQEKLKEEKKKKDSKNAGMGCLAIIIIIAVIYVISTLSPSKSSNSEQSTPKLNAAVRYTGTQIFIKNNDSFDWNNLKIELNSGLLNSGYYLEASSIKAGTTATVGILNFAKSNGERLNPLAIKVRSVSIFADTPSGRAYYAGKWD